MSWLRNIWYVAAMHDELPADGSSVRVRRKLRALIEAEQQTTGETV